MVVVRGEDEQAGRAFFNVCRHHAATVVTDSHGSAGASFRCPYHGWTYALDGALKGTPDFTGVCDFRVAGERARTGRVRCGIVWAFVTPYGGALSL